MGKLKGKTVTKGNTGMLSYKDDSGTKVEVKYDQVFADELGIGVGTRVSFNLVATSEGNIAVAVAPINKGTITDIDYTNGAGSITETESGLVYKFQQNYLKEAGLTKDQIVTYNLVCSKDVIYATCLTAVI